MIASDAGRDFVRNFAYLIGQPGSGKSTLMAALTESQLPSVNRKPFAHIEYLNGAVQLGAVRAEFSGTDALGMDVQPKVLRWMEDEGPLAVLGEGDRLANGKFFDAVKELGYNLTVVLLWVPDDLAAERRAARGSAQNETWLAGRLTKIKNLRPYVTHMADGRRPVAELVESLRALPVFDKF